MLRSSSPPWLDAVLKMERYRKSTETSALYMSYAQRSKFVHHFAMGPNMSRLSLDSRYWIPVSSILIITPAIKLCTSHFQILVRFEEQKTHGRDIRSFAPLM